MKSKFGQLLVALCAGHLSLAAIPCFGNINAVPKDSKDALPAPSHPRVILALGGGGVRGAAHVGVLKVLQEEKIPIDGIAGTSIGAVIGGFYAAGMPITHMEANLKNRALLKAYNAVPIPLRIFLVPITTIPRAIGIHPYVGLFCGTKLTKYLDHVIPTECKNIEHMQIPFRAVATDLLTGEPYAISHGPLSKALVASTALPILRKPVQIDGKFLCDGFLCGSNLPIREARDMGADIVICVNIDGPLKQGEACELRHLKSYQTRLTNIMMDKLDHSDISQADLVINPDVSKVAILSSSTKDVLESFNAGEIAARRAVPEIRKLIHMANTRMAEKETAQPY